MAIQKALSFLNQSQPVDNLEVNDVPQPSVTVTQKSNIGAPTIDSTTKQNLKKNSYWGF